MRTVWDLRARYYDLFEASDFRRGPFKSRLFQGIRGRTLFVAIGTGLDIRRFPPDAEIVAIDISEEMLRRANERRGRHAGTLHLVRADALKLCFPDDSFDTVATSCTLCSVPDPLLALREFHRVLRPEGRLLMFEHVRSRNFVFGLALDVMTLFTRRGGTEMNRDTLGNARAAGFLMTRVENVFLDIILAIQGVKAAPRAPAWSERVPAGDPGDGDPLACRVRNPRRGITSSADPPASVDRRTGTDTAGSGPVINGSVEQSSPSVQPALLMERPQDGRSGSHQARSTGATGASRRLVQIRSGERRRSETGACDPRAMDAQAPPRRPAMRGSGRPVDNGAEPVRSRTGISLPAAAAGAGDDTQQQNGRTAPATGESAHPGM